MNLDPASIRRKILYAIKLKAQLEALLVTMEALTKDVTPKARRNQVGETSAVVAGSSGNLTLALDILKAESEPVHVNALFDKMRARGSVIKSVTTLRSYLRDDNRFVKKKRAYWTAA
jgi:hypothetical protein